MLLLRFVFANIGFILSIFGALVFFSTGLLYFDSWQVDKKNKHLIIRGFGFFLVAFSLAGFAALYQSDFYQAILQITKVIGLFLIWISLFTEPLLAPPTEKNNLKSFIPISYPLLFFMLAPVSSILIFAIAITYLIKSTTGYEKQLKPAFWAFLVLGLAESVGIVFFWKDTTNVYYSKILSDYNLVWWIQQSIRFLGLLILARWTWGYIRFRVRVQLFVATVTATLVIFITTTLFFTLLIFKNIESTTLSQLQTDVKVLQYSIEKLQEKVLSDAQTMSQDELLKKAVDDKDSNALYNVTSDYLISKNASFLTVTNEAGEVLMRAEDRNNVGDSLGTDPIVKAALEGRRLSTLIMKQEDLLPSIEISASSPIIIDSKNIGTVVTGIFIDNAFVDGIKKVTDLDVSVFAKDTQSATTFYTSDGKTRFVGTKESNPKVLEEVLSKGSAYSGPSQILNQPYYVSYTPLKSYGGETIGMLFVGKLQTTLMESANNSLETTFAGSVILMLISLIPAYYISRYINDQITS